MGYTTRFTGGIELSRPLSIQEAAFWMATYEGIFDRDARFTVSGMPDSYLQWVPSEDLKAIVFDGNEKFYDYTEWLKWVIDNWIVKWGITANGEMLWSGEQTSDNGVIRVINNVVEAVSNQQKQPKSRQPLTHRKLAAMIIKSTTPPEFPKL